MTKEMPEKIYIFDYNDAMVTPMEGDTVYIREDAFIEKACDWLADNYSKYIITNGLATIFRPTIDFDTIRMIENFKKAMED